MSLFEIISVLISVLAVVVSLTALSRSRKNHAQLLELEQVHAELSRKQLADFEKREQQVLKANLTISLEKEGQMSKFVIKNAGPAIATNIYFGLEQDNDCNPLVSGDFEAKIPFPALAPQEQYYLLADIPLDVRQLTFSISLRWNNEDGTQERVVRSVAV
ncbi:hypothetical protein [Marinobacter sp.]|uniref:hypothetical protein n=1 Tax=Marinobacter sp. TaxID=50741 RepID=UPI003A909AD6